MNDRLALVTGSTGFIGSRLARHLLDQGWKVRISLRANSPTDRLASLACERVIVDLASGDPMSLGPALNGVTHVFHVAGCVAGTPAQLDKVNRQGTEWLASYAAGLPTPPVFVLVSSAAAGGPSTADRPRHPAERPAPVSKYGRSKLAGELAALAHVPPLPLSIVRPGIVFGEGDREFINLFRAMVRFRINPMIGRGCQPLGMIDVDDLCRLLVHVAERGERVEQRDAEGFPLDGRGIYNAADPQPLSLVEIGRIVREVAGRPRIPDIRLPAAVGYVVGGIAEFSCRLVGRTSTLNRDKITEARATGWALDVSKSMEDLGWSPERPIDHQVRTACEKAIAQFNSR